MTGFYDNLHLIEGCKVTKKITVGLPDGYLCAPDTPSGPGCVAILSTIYFIGIKKSGYSL